MRITLEGGLLVMVATSVGGSAAVFDPPFEFVNMMVVVVSSETRLQDW